jgi:hypothetical protein
MFASETAGTPLGKREAKAGPILPADTSVTLPSTSMPLPSVKIFDEAVKVVAVGPLPMRISAGHTYPSLLLCYRR